MAGITRINDLSGIPRVLRDYLGQFLWGVTAGAPTAASTGIKATGTGSANRGSMIVDTTNGALYKNTGTKALPVWNAIGTVAASELTLAEGWLMIGNSSGVGVAIDGGTTTEFLVGNGTTMTSVAMSSDATMDNAGAVTIAANAVDEQKMVINIPVTVPITAILSDRGGLNSDGVMVGTLPHTALADVTEDHQTVFKDLTTEAGDASGNDVTLPDPFDANDAIYFGYGSIFSALVFDVGTQAVGAAIAAETEFEYYNGSTWAAVTELTDDGVVWSAGTGTYVASFLPPSNWAAVAVDGGSSLFFVRIRGTAADIFNSTQGIVDQVWCLPLAAGSGPQMPFDCTMTAIEGTATVASATNDDTEILVINVTAGTFAKFTWSGGDVVDATTGLTLAFTAGDQYAVQILSEDGSTEFDGVTLQLICSVG